MQKMTLEQYAMKILVDHDCDIYTYGGSMADCIMDDLKTEYPQGMLYPYIEVANAILSISRPQPIVKRPYMVCWDNDSACDGFDVDSLGEAISDAEDTLSTWICDEVSGWKDINNPTQEEINNYDYMIYNYSVWVDQYNPDTDEYETIWEPDEVTEKAVGWLTWDELKQQMESEDR